MVDHGIPAIERAVDILDCLAAGAGPMTIREITAATGLVRTTVYRSLNTLCARGLARQVSEKAYALGPHLLRLARAVPQGVDLTALARPHLERLAQELGVAAKLSIVDGEDALVVAVAEAPGTYSVTTQVGRRFPLHAGAASKLLLAHLPSDRKALFLRGRLPAVTSNTVTDPGLLTAELERILRQGHAIDRGEFVEGVHAVAAPVFDRWGGCIAAVSVPYVASVRQERARAIRASVEATAARISAEGGA